MLSPRPESAANCIDQKSKDAFSNQGSTAGKMEATRQPQSLGESREPEFRRERHLQMNAPTPNSAVTLFTKVGFDYFCGIRYSDRVSLSFIVPNGIISHHISIDNWGIGRQTGGRSKELLQVVELRSRKGYNNHLCTHTSQTPTQKGK